MANDYDFEPRVAPSLFLKLKEKGDKVLIRLASSPYREPKIWKVEGGPPMDPTKAVDLSEDQWRRLMGDPDYNITEAFYWVVIDRESGTAKIFTGTAGVYKNIKKYAEMEGWGDPTTYDFQIVRTENPGPSYYEVTALPNKEALSEKEQKLVDELISKIPEKLPAARRITEAQIDHIPEMDDRPASANHAATTSLPPLPAEKDVVIEDIDDKPINLDDIPF